MGRELLPVTIMGELKFWPIREWYYLSIHNSAGRGDIRENMRSPCEYNERLHALHVYALS